MGRSINMDLVVYGRDLVLQLTCIQCCKANHPAATRDEIFQLRERRWRLLQLKLDRGCDREAEKRVSAGYRLMASHQSRIRHRLHINFRQIVHCECSDIAKLSLVTYSSAAQLRMSESLIAALSAKFPDQLPPWVDPFRNAVKRMEILEKREQDDSVVTSDVKPKSKTTKKKKKTSRKGKGKEEAVPEEGLGDDVEDTVMMQCAEELLETVRSEALQSISGVDRR